MKFRTFVEQDRIHTEHINQLDLSKEQAMLVTTVQTIRQEVENADEGLELAKKWVQLYFKDSKVADEIRVIQYQVDDSDTVKAIARVQTFTAPVTMEDFEENYSELEGIRIDGDYYWVLSCDNPEEVKEPIIIVGYMEDENIITEEHLLEDLCNKENVRLFISKRIPKNVKEK